MPAPESSSPAASTLARADDAKLVTLIRAGHETAFAELHRRHRPALLRLARAVLRGSSHDADDVLQEAFLSAYFAIRAVDRPSRRGPGSR
jgi:DNA-directed RNA polymerase specialized sigma24 family protein